MGPKEFKPTALERIASNPATGISAAAIAAGFAGTTPVAIFLPALFAGLAGRLHGERLERFIEEVTADLQQQAEKLERVTDAQYQIISDAVVSALHTLDSRKLEFLRFAINNVLEHDIEPAQSAYIARVIRDISAEEAEFLMRTTHAEGYYFVAQHQEEGAVIVDPDSADGVAVCGLMALGLLRMTGGFGGVIARASSAEVVCELLSQPQRVQKD